MKLNITLEFDENDLGPKWMNSDNFNTLLYTTASTKKDLLKVVSFEEVGAKSASSKRLCEPLSQASQKGMKEDIKKELLKKAQEGRVVLLTCDGLMEIDLDEFIKQPAQGILYDLNRGPATVLNFVNDDKWINDFAVGLVIGKLKALLTA